MFTEAGKPVSLRCLRVFEIDNSILLVEDAPAERASGDHKLKIYSPRANAGDLLYVSLLRERIMAAVNLH